jgi:hypothetical protein
MKPGNKITFIILAWWYGLLILGEIGSAIDIGMEAIIFIILAIACYSFGYSISYNFIFIKPYRIKTIVISSNKVLIAIIIIQLILSFLSVKYILTNPSNIRDLIFSEPEKIFYLKYIFQFYATILFPIGFYIIFQYKYFRIGRNEKILIITFFICDTLISFGRFSIYILLIYILINYLTDNNLKKINYLRLLFYFIIGFIFINLVFNARYTGDIALFSGLNGLKNYVYDSIINYHIVGFGILDKFINREFIFEDKGILSFGFIEYIFTKFINLFGISSVSSYAELGEYLQSTYINIGDTKYISFPTILLPFYIDFGFIGTCVLLFLMGCLVGQCKYSNYQISPFGKYFSALMLIGIFQTVLISQFFYIPIILNIIGFRCCNENK